MTEPKKPFHERVAETLIGQLQAGTAPWQRPWAASVPYLPMNPVTGKRYQGINTIQLLAQGRSDPRWMTFRQALGSDAQVRKGEHGTSVQYWKFNEQQVERGADGKPVLAADGSPKKVTVLLERPRVFYAVVFNAEQIDGLPVLEQKPRAWDPIERAEALLRRSGAAIVHGGDRAFYSPLKDAIWLPAQGQFSSAMDYYATALHELGHWTGHPTRLDRDIVHPFGSEGYAREELRAEIASMIVGDELGLGHDPSQHVAYVGHWIAALKKDPLEIFRAASAAEKIRNFVLAFEQQHEQEHEREAHQEPREHEDQEKHEEENTTMKSETRTYIAVPYNEREEAKRAGARWDRALKSWYAPANVPRSSIERWLPERVPVQQAPALSARDELAATLRESGFVLADDHPIMDGEKHRLPVEGDRKGARSGFYVAHLDGHPAGYIQNHRTGAELRWKAKGYTLDEAAQAKLRAEAATKQRERHAQQEKLYEQTAQRLGKQLAGLSPATLPTLYMQRKGIGTHPGVYTDAEHKTYVPAVDATGKLWTIQYIDAEGTKRFAKSSRKHGCFHAIGGLPSLAAADVLIIAEGYATAATCNELLGKPVVAAFDAGNLLPVAQALHAKHPDKAVLIVADDDQAQERERGLNPGRQKAFEAAKAVGGHVVLPIFAPAEQRDHPRSFSDFNDLAVRSVLGRDAATTQLRHAHEQALLGRAQHREPQRLEQAPALRQRAHAR